MCERDQLSEEERAKRKQELFEFLDENLPDLQELLAEVVRRLYEEEPEDWEKSS